MTGFTGLSPFVCPSVIAVAEGIPFMAYSLPHDTAQTFINAASQAERQ
jgi:hypothetical protein